MSLPIDEDLTAVPVHVAPGDARCLTHSDSRIEKEASHGVGAHLSSRSNLEVDPPINLRTAEGGDHSLWLLEFGQAEAGLAPFQVRVYNSEPNIHADSAQSTLA